MFLAYQLDKQIRGSRFYQSIFYIPVVIAPAIIGLISELILSPQQGLISSLFADPRHGHVIDWLGDPSRSLWAVLVLACWRHASYVMIIYLAGLKALDPTLREAAAIDGASGTRTYFRVVLPALKPINIVLVVITVIEALRAFDIVYIINRGRNGLELLSVLITGNIIGEASRIGYGSAIAVVLLTISLVPIVIFVWNSFQEVPES
jgi:multiple sugar transport system permease protein/raffinose/stachyose/melibiose transport system permease protein